MQGRIPDRSACRHRGRRSLRYIVRSQRGGALIEIMMSALLVALAATAVFKGIDGATATSGQSKSRAVAVTLAQEDQERMRSMDPRKLSNYAPTPAKKIVNDVEYTVTSTASYVSDRGDSESCTKGDGRVTYVKINSKVDWPDMRSSKAVQSSSIVAINNAYAKGSLAVKIVDRTGNTGVPSIPVSVDPPVSLTKDTNDAGCVVFDGLASGQYFGQFSKAGYVDPNGTNVVRPANGWNVTTGSTSISTYQYDLAGAIVFAFDTKYGTNTWSVTNPDAVTLMHQNIPGPPQQGARIQTVANGTSTYTFGALFPFLTPYTSFAGDCSATAPPATFPNQVHTVGPGATVGSVAAPKTLRMPTLAYKVTRTNGSGVTSNRQNARVKVRPATGTCITPRAFASLTPAKLTDANGDLKPAGSSDANDFALPYGSFIACADDNNGASTKKNESPTILNDDPNGKTVTINIDTRVGASNGTSSGSC